MIVLHRDQPTADTLKLLIALAEAGTRFDTTIVDTGNYGQWADPHRDIAPQGQVPVLVVDGEAMPDAQFALQYVGEAHAPALVPDDAWSWYRVQALNQQLDAAIGPAVNLLGWTVATNVQERGAHRERLAAIAHREKPAGWYAVWADAEANEDQLANARERIGQGLDALEAGLTGSKWLVGDGFSLADVNAWPLVRAVVAVLPDALAGRPRLEAWLDRVAERESVRAVWKDERKIAFSPPP